MSLVCCETDFDIKMLTSFGEVNKYKLIGNTLTFEGSKGKVIFRKQ